MTEFSGRWTAPGSTGHQVAAYTEVHDSTLSKIAAACSGFEGIAPGYLNELNLTEPSANTVRLDTGGAMVDGKAYENDAAIDINVPNPGAGNARIDLIVLRADWSGFQVAAHRIEGTASGSPSAPSIVQTSGTTYDVRLWRVHIDENDSITITDQRVYASHLVDDSTLEESDGALQVKDAGIPNAKLADMGQYTVKGRSVGSTGVPQNIQASVADTILAFVSNAIDFVKITLDMIPDGLITGSKLAANTLGQGQIADNAIGSGELQTGSVLNAKLATDSVTQDKIAANAVGSSEIQSDAVATDEIADDSVDDTKAGSRVPQFYRRQGGSATSWGLGGTTTRTPDAVRMQGGAVNFSMGGVVGITIDITFPEPFSDTPLVFPGIGSDDWTTSQFIVMIDEASISATGVTIQVYTRTGDPSLGGGYLTWMAIGPE